MKLQETLPVLTEMAAKKECPHCGKTMAANHYWYKGGWKCKKGGAAAPTDKPVEKKPEGEMTTQEIARHSKTDPHHAQRSKYKAHVSDAGAKVGLNDLFKKQKDAEKDKD